MVFVPHVASKIGIVDAPGFGIMERALKPYFIS